MRISVRAAILSITLLPPSPVAQVQYHRNVSSVLFAAFFATLIWFGTTLVSRLCTVLMIGMAVSYLLFNAGLVLHVEIFKLFNTQVQGESYSQYIWAALPYFLTSFGFAGLVPSLVKYYGPEPKTVHRCMLYGTLITLGALSDLDFGGIWHPITRLVGAGYRRRRQYCRPDRRLPGVTEAHSQNMSLLLNLFSNFAVTSSISAVGLVCSTISPTPLALTMMQRGD